MKHILVDRQTQTYIHVWHIWHAINATTMPMMLMIMTIFALSVCIFLQPKREGERKREGCRKLTLCICKMLTHYSKIIAQLFAINVIVIIVITVVVLLFVDVAPAL